MYHETMKLPRFNFSTFQLLLLTALVALGIVFWGVTLAAEEDPNAEA